MAHYEIYKALQKHPRTYLVFDYSKSVNKILEMFHIAKRYFHANGHNIWEKIGYVWEDELFFEKPNSKAKKKMVFYYIANPRYRY